MLTEALPRVRQSPVDPDFVQNPYPFYDRCRALGDFVYWEDYGLPAAVSHRAVQAVLKHRRMGRAPVEPVRYREALAPFYQVEAHSMLELEPPAHTRLRGLVLRAFTSRRIRALAPEIETLCTELVAAFPDGPFDLLDAYARHVPVIVIARLLGVPESMSGQLLTWSNDMVAMYQARRDMAVEDRAAEAAAEFADFMRGYVEERRAHPADDLITHLIEAEAEGERLTTDELISTCILLLNAGHEATVHSIGNAVKTLLNLGLDAETFVPGAISDTVEELLRFDPPLHMFTRHVYDEVELFGRAFARGDEIACLLAAANRDPGLWPDPNRFDPSRPMSAQLAFGAGLHFCVGAPLARLELQIALPVLFRACPRLTLAEPPRYANVYHFHGLDRLMVTV